MMKAAEVRPREQVHGFLNVNKPSNCTSMDVVRRVKRLTDQRRRVGHGGTLDPLAKGILPICFGQATRLMEHLVDAPKDYFAKICLGVTTSTYDAEGDVVATHEVAELARGEVEQALSSFCGIIYQIPPMYSALKHQGKRLYELARKGVEVEREPRRVEVYQIQLAEFDSPYVTLEVKCGRGVYMRSLAHQIGEALGCGAYLTELVRRSSGNFTLENSIHLADLEKACQEDSEGWMEYLKPVDFPLLDLNSTVVARSAERLIRNGQSVSLGPGLSYAGYMEKYRAYTTDGYFLGIIRFNKADNQWRPAQVFSVDKPSPYAPKGE